MKKSDKISRFKEYKSVNKVKINFMTLPPRLHQKKPKLANTNKQE